MNTINKTIGVLGGMGPEASSMLYARMIKYTQREYGAEQDTDYPPMFIYSLPLIGFNETGIVDEELVLSQLIDGVVKLETSGADLIIIACNTVHLFYDEMQEAVDVPIFNIIEKTKNRVADLGYQKVGLMASESTSNLNLYQQEFAGSGITVISPCATQQEKLNRVIKNVMGGNQGADDRSVLMDIAKNYHSRGAEAVVMGCTEIPLAINQSDTRIKLFDTIEIIIQCAVDYSLKE